VGQPEPQGGRATLVRDVYARMAMGNKKLIDLGEARLGYFAVPTVAEQGRPLSENLFMTGTLGREAWLAGRELAASYEIGGRLWGVPARVSATLGSGVECPPQGGARRRPSRMPVLTAGAFRPCR